MADSTEEGKTKFLDEKEPDRPLSRYNNLRLLLNQDSIPIIESWDPIELEELPEDRFYEVTAPLAHRPDLISKIYYGTEQLYWVIARVNGMVDPFAETTVGKKLRIPDRDNLFHTILGQ